MYLKDANDIVKDVNYKKALKYLTNNLELHIKKQQKCRKIIRFLTIIGYYWK
jgi:hypothetical protein